MRESKVSARYARSLMDQAMTSNSLEKVKEDLVTILDTIKGSRELQSMFESPIINTGNKAVVAGKVFKGRVSDETFRFIELVIVKKREMLLLNIAQEFMNSYHQMHHIGEVVVTTAQPLSDAARSGIQTDLEKKLSKKLIITYKTDAEIIGGIIIHFGDKLYDASIAHQLRQVKQELIQSYISKN